MVEPVVSLHGVHKAFNLGLPNETEVLHGIDLTLARGEFCAVMGPSGSGKSTLLNIVGLLDRPTSGSLRIGGKETRVLDERALTRLRGHNIGFIFQYHNLLAGFTAVENVMMPMLGDAGFFNEDMERRAAELLDNVGLERWRDSMVTQLSGGQQQRVAVARSLAMDPPLLLADEPTGNLDTKAADAVFELLQKANRERGMAILFVTHNPELARRCDRIIQVVDGQIQA
ncbi:ABC transporter ATP-binding protein [Variovorax paradoxus]|uniref:ABC transporter ATP-binding protein n=1 Tax=Variovorax paradoxus TaxID=34073 RepID=UPI0006E60A22|nr:ABC transporter ATP-binding protein [Variovorax paradoxus]KPV10395.1 ABC transporter ATP-binding protein [Variovorax paradoxus]KPV12871.1 ABC transporter ATP-binding protein [Variovorax paradoxus]KPV24095.1 ABC transporter ATP-binding protein [Variovorax paradoxus]KPV35213.1 ABC transporter ATP-binding protein [Variovorax paradoxus]